MDTPTTVALIMAAAALITAFLAWQRAGAQARQLENARTELARIQKELSQNRAKLETDLRQIRQGIGRETGRTEFRPEMTISEALEVHPGVKAVLATYSLTGCPECAVSDVDTLEGACRSYGIDLVTLMKALSALVGPSSPDLKRRAAST